jgi:hypothetical protein
LDSIDWCKCYDLFNVIHLVPSPCSCFIVERRGYPVYLVIEGRKGMYAMSSHSVCSISSILSRVSLVHSLFHWILPKYFCIHFFFASTVVLIYQCSWFYQIRVGSSCISGQNGRFSTLYCLFACPIWSNNSCSFPIIFARWWIC